MNAYERARLEELLAIKAESERVHGDTSDMSAEEEAELEMILEADDAA